MSRTTTGVRRSRTRFPRVSGDEPWEMPVAPAGLVFSLRERG